MSSQDAFLPARPRRDDRTREVLETLGDEKLQEALAFGVVGGSPNDPPSKAQQVLERLADPVYANTSLVKIMRDVGLSLPEVFDLVRRRDLAVAMLATSEGVADVLEGLREEATPRWVICNSCEGEGEVADISIPITAGEAIPMKACKRCSGSGKVRQSPSIDAAKLFLGVHGVHKTGGGAPAVAVNLDVKQQQNNVNQGSADPRKPPQQESVTSRVQRALEGGSEEE